MPTLYLKKLTMIDEKISLLKKIRKSKITINQKQKLIELGEGRMRVIKKIQQAINKLGCEFCDGTDNVGYVEVEGDDILVCEHCDIDGCHNEIHYNCMDEKNYYN